MRKIIESLYILTAFVAISCQTENNKPDIPTYQLESILVESNNPVGFTGSALVRTDSLYLDSIYQLSFDPGLSMYEKITKTGDSVLYTTIPDITGFYSHARASFFQNRYSSSSFYSANQNYVNSADVSYSYSSVNRLTGFSMLTEKRQDAYIQLIQNAQCTLDYVNNDVSRVNYTASYRSDNVYLNSDFNPIDTTILRDSSAIFTYLTVQNQKNMIGIDLNDLIFNDFVNSFGSYIISYGGLINYPLLEKILLLNGKISYNTNCQHLMNRIEFGYATISDHSFIFPPHIINVNYNFDNVHNNRINTLEITNEINFPIAYSITTKYTFNYKD